ncbi:hypothetical protein KCP75_24265 [Salmonella enterica subsp. enterica]|nr:hypothetical protein KCP75_24265 [Salmonella enterica subsp. enterica]
MNTAKHVLCCAAIMAYFISTSGPLPPVRLSSGRGTRSRRDDKLSALAGYLTPAGRDAQARR